MTTPTIPESLRLLIVDDDEARRATVRVALGRADLIATADEVATGADARDRLLHGHYDGVIVRERLPDCDSVALVRELRAAGIAVPILVAASTVDDALEQEVVDAGANDYLTTADLAPSRLARRMRFAIRVARSESESARAVVRAENMARARDEVLAIVSHDLRGPLNAIGLACEALREEAGSEAARRYLGAIERAATRAERLIKDLLEAMRIENGGIEIAPRPLDGRILIEQALVDHELIAKETGGRIESRVPDHPVPVFADRERVLQVLSNLIGNAIKHAKGTPIALTLAERDGQAVFGVDDQGPGIPADELPHVFDRYWQGRKRRRAGAGLGLAIAKGIIEAHRGTIAVDSEPGRGTHFEFTLGRAGSPS